MSERVKIVLPTGERATVPQEDLEQAIAAGAQVATAPAHRAIDTGFGLIQGSAGTDFVADKVESQAARISGGAAAVTGGLSDLALAEGAYILGGEKLERDVTGAMKTAKEAHPYQYMLGEGAGLALGPLGELGEAVQARTAATVGEGLLGSAAGMGVRGAVEGAAMGAQHQITEDALEGHDLIGQQIFASAAKDGLLGGALGGALGAAGYGLGRAGNLLTRSRGPASDAVLDEVAGGVGGRALRDDARAAEGMIADLEKAGATSEQAAKMVSDVQKMSVASGNAGPLSGMLDDVGASYIAKRAGGNEEMAQVLAKGYQERSLRLYDSARVVDEQALKLKAATDRVLRAEAAMDEAQFLQRPDRMAKLIDTSRGELQRDLAARVNQEVDETLKLLEGTATKGGSAVAVSKLRKQLTDVAKLSVTAARDEAGRIIPIKPKQLHEIYMGVNRMKQAVGRESGFGIPPHLRTEAQREFGGLHEKLRVALEDEAVWGAEAGSNQRVLNEVFATDFKRSNDFANRFTVGLDEAKGVPLPEADAEKIKNGLLKKLGSEADSDQAIKTLDVWRDRNYRRIAALKEHGDLTPEQAKLVTDGETALKDFEGVFAEARKESETVAKLERQQLEEQGRGMGGLIGLAGDIITRPLTSMQRLAEIRHTTRGIEKAIERGFAKVFKSSSKYASSAGTAAEQTAPRAKEEVVKEIGEIKELAASPDRMQERITRFVGDLPKHAPKIADEVAATATRAIYYLAKEAPPAGVRLSLVGVHNAKERYSDQQVAAWEAKRRAVLGAVKGETAPETLLADMHKGRLNRDAIQAIEFVSPRLFAQMQEMAWEELQRMESKGLLDAMPYQRKAAIASLLKVPPDRTWQPDFIKLMQGAKAMPAPIPEPSSPAPQNGASKRAIKMNTAIYSTEAGRIEGMVQ